MAIALRARQNPFETVGIRRLGQTMIEAGIERRLNVRVLTVSAERDQAGAVEAAIATNPARHVEPAHHRQAQVRPPAWSCR